MALHTGASRLVPLHIRDRVWIVAADPSRGGHGLDGLGEALQRQLNHPGAYLADADGISAWGLSERTSSPHAGAGLGCEDVADSDSERKPHRKGASPSSGDGLATTVRMFPTPSASEYTSNRSASPNAAIRYSLTGMARYGKWPTPKCLGCFAVVEPIASGAQGEGPADPPADGSFPRMVALVGN